MSLYGTSGMIVPRLEISILYGKDSLNLFFQFSCQIGLKGILSFLNWLGQSIVNTLCFDFPLFHGTKT